MDSSLTSPTDILLEEPLSVFSQVDPRLLQAHPRNQSKCQGVQLQPLTNSQTGSASGNRSSPHRSYWNCWHRGELIGNDSFYCDRMETLSILEQDANTRGAKYDLWREHWYQTQDTTSSQATQATDYTLTLLFSPHLPSLFEDAARAAEMSVVEWAHHQLKIAALSARRANQLSGRGQN